MVLFLYIFYRYFMKKGCQVLKKLKVQAYYMSSKASLFVIQHFVFGLPVSSYGEVKKLFKNSAFTSTKHINSL